MGYQPMPIARLGELIAGSPDPQRWRLVAEFLEVREVREATFPDEPLPKRSELLLEELFDREEG